ncbi:MAG TPA: sodium/proton-translocating pyrophosphatase, partial [Gemmataceae bacterium]|nr:sodium/proton-translocating pyrophosphatase [Gemmataceae bacterium]
MANTRSLRNLFQNYDRRGFRRSFWLMVSFMVIGFMGMSGCSASGPTAHEWHPFSFMTDPDYNFFERIALIANVFIAGWGLYYAYTLIKEVYGAETGTPRMQEIARAVREGALAYLKRQFTTVAIMIVILTFVLILTANPHTEAGWNIPIGRGIAFLM